MIVRAKFKVVEVTQFDAGPDRKVKLGAVYDPLIPEDQRFAQATPSGECWLYINNPAAAAQFKPGHTVYLDFVFPEDKPESVA